jgi:hypothetical protein
MTANVTLRDLLCGQKAILEHWHGDTFRTRWENPLVAQERVAFVAFRVDEDGKAAALHMELFREPIDAKRAEE